ncbi:TIGR04140 family protein [Pyrococcus horikoshii]|uniref:TIGR04140 family protein n=1 Tax=Pyrococcus horikoshii TaxID=53953 RepID=A0A832WH04_PYRHR|nr:TIGR04140 family protein [Pyrococcus horikoshii]HII60650.1 TIGR04140 family protein [Pyrococcus horikoshii]
MRAIIKTSISPQEIKDIAKGLNLSIKILGKEEIRIITLWKIEIEGEERKIKAFMKKLRMARAGG